MTDGTIDKLCGLYSRLGISRDDYLKAEEILSGLNDRFKEIDMIREANQLKVVSAFHDVGLSESHFAGTTGYGYDDVGRDKLEKAFANIMSAESSLLRWQISSGTTAISLTLFGVLRPGDIMLSVTGKPYDTLTGVIGINGKGTSGSLAEFGIGYRQVDFDLDGNPDLEGIREAISPEVKVIFIQKSRGYAARRTLLNKEIAGISDVVRRSGSEAVIIVDNCYGEFVETTEPCGYGADLCCGSLIKNPGGGIAITGGYVAGKTDLVEMAACRLNAPGVGSHIGPTAGMNRMIALGMYLAPHTVSEAVKSAVFSSAYLEHFGIKSDPGPLVRRGDIVQSFELGSEERLIAFCRSIQSASPIDAHVTPIPWDMPGYDCEVIMAAGAFTQGASIEMSCDAPLREPYRAYFQGGIVFDNVKLAAMIAMSDLRSLGLEQ